MALRGWHPFICSSIHPSFAKHSYRYFVLSSGTSEVRGHFCSFFILGLWEGPGPGWEEDGPALKMGVAISGIVFIANPICVEAGKGGVPRREQLYLPSPYLCMPFPVWCLGGAWVTFYSTYTVSLYMQPSVWFRIQIRFRPCNSDGSLKSLSIGRLPLFLLPPPRNVLVETTRLSCKVSQSLGFAHSILVVILNVPLFL